MTSETIHLVGFGSQGKAWANCLKTSGWNVEVYLPEKSRSHLEAKKQGFQSFPLAKLRENITFLSSLFSVSTHSDSGTSHGPAWVVMTCPDQEIGAIYDEIISHADTPVNLVLAHGFAVYSGDLVPRNKKHKPYLLAPKAIGPKLLENFQLTFPKTHDLVAAVSVQPSDPDFIHLERIARGLGFSSKNLIPTSFEQETLGDLISEQGLLCGGVFNLMAWTYQSMLEAGIPPRLIQEECISELELIAGLIKSKGPASAFKSISQVAQAGTIAMEERFQKGEFLEQFLSQIESIKNGDFINYFKSKKWQPKASDLVKRLSEMEEFSNDFRPKKERLS